MRVEHQQGAYDVRCEWGRHGVELLARECAVVVIVDVLSFCTSVDVAVGRGARVLPQRWHNPYAAREAATHGAMQAGPSFLALFTKVEMGVASSSSSR